VLASAAIRLLPDWTLVVQLVIFLIVLAVLSTFVIQPMLKLMDRRRSFTGDAMQSAAKFSADADQLEVGRREMMSMALREAQAKHEACLQSCRRDADRTIAEARVGVTELLRHGIHSIESAETLAEIDLQELSKELAGDIERRLQA
jgi:F-type H+-transporting ATPase subunit b